MQAMFDGAQNGEDNTHITWKTSVQISMVNSIMKALNGTSHKENSRRN